MRFGISASEWLAVFPQLWSGLEVLVVLLM